MYALWQGTVQGRQGGQEGQALDTRSEMITRPHKVLDGAKLEEWAARFAPDLLSAWEYGPCNWVEFWVWMDLKYPDEFSRFEEWYLSQFEEWYLTARKK